MKYLITGGAGFTGINFADILLSRGDEVIVFDNFSRAGTLENIRWLWGKHPNVRILQGDIRIDQQKILEAVSEVDVVFHLAAQVAVTTSVVDPKSDFEINALGTFNLLEAVRKSENQPAFIYASTNKVYGGMEEVSIVEKDGRYQYRDLPEGIEESMPLDFHSPYGCSKGTGDQYTRDYARIYGLRTAVMRQSCIYGKHQLGVEDQGWVAWFTIATVLEKKITIYGDGKQVRDVLYVDDLFKVWDLTAQQLQPGDGRVYNIGGGSMFQLSLLELLDQLQNLTGKKIDYTFTDWRPGDQRIYVSNPSKAQKELDWKAEVSPDKGVQILFEWVNKNKEIFKYI